MEGGVGAGALKQLAVRDASAIIANRMLIFLLDMTYPPLV